MALNVNRTAITAVNVNGKPIDKVTVNGVTVWESGKSYRAKISTRMNNGAEKQTTMNSPEPGQPKVEKIITVSL